VTGGQVRGSQGIEEVLNRASPSFAVSEDKVYDSQKVHQQIKDKGALSVVPSRSIATKKSSLSQADLPATVRD